MLDQLRKLILFSAFSLLIIPATAFAWRDYTYQDWNWHGSGRDYPYSYYIDNYYSPERLGYSTFIFSEEPYVNYINDTIPPAPAPLPSPPSDGFTVNIPNNHGGYTAVLIKKLGNGFVGPQGEYYSQFPKVSQLTLMYGK